MKPYYDIAVVKDGSKIAGFIFGHKSNLIDISKFNYSRVQYFPLDDVVLLTKDDRVSYFKWDESNNCIKIEYTQEELALIKKNTGKAGLSLVDKLDTFEDYCDNDVLFEKCYVDLVEKHGAIAGTLINVIKFPFVGEVYGFMFYGGNGLGQRIQGWINGLGNLSRTVSPIYLNDNIASLVMPASLYEQFAVDFKVLTTVNTKRKKKPNGIAGMMYTSQETMIENKAKIDSINDKVMLTHRIF